MMFTDQLQRKVILPVWPPQRIVSLVPSQTELLYDLGLGAAVAGITKFCVHPAEWFREKNRVGGTKTLDFKKIDALKPDLIIGNKEENERGQIEQLAEKYPVWMSDIATLDDAYDMMLRVGELTGKQAESRHLVEKIKNAFTAIRLPGNQHRRPSVAYFIWRKPYMVAGSGTFIDAMLHEAGFENVFAQKDRYPEISLEKLAEARPEFILLSSEPYPFAEKHFAAFREVCPESKIARVDGELFSWYGSRLLYSAAYFQELRKTWSLA